MQQFDQTRIYPIDSVSAPASTTNAAAASGVSGLSTTTSATIAVVGGILVFGLLALAVTIPIITSLNASASMTTTSTSTTSTTVTTSTTSLAAQWNATGSTQAGSSVGSSGVTASLMSIAYSLALDSSNAIYVTDYSNNRIQKWVQGASSATTVAGQSNGASGASSTALSTPVGIILDSSNNMYFTDRGNHRVMYWANGASSGSVIAGITGSAGNANNQFSSPSGLIRNSTSGTLYIADTGNDRIMQYLSGASSGTVVAGGNGRGTASNQLNLPYGFAIDSSSNSFIIVNYGAHNVVRWIFGASSWTLLAGSASGTSGSTSTLLANPLSVVLDPYSNMYVTDTANHRVQFFLAGSSNGTTIAGTTGVSGSAANQLNLPYWAIIDSQLNLYVADTFNHRIQKFSRS